MTKKTKKLLSVITLNVKGFSDYTKRHSTFLSLRSHPADIILLQETNITPLQISFIQSQWLLSSYWNYYTAILINNKNVIVNKFQEFYGEHYTFLEFSLNGTLYNINNIYAPPQRKERLSFWTNLSLYSNSEAMNLIGGDFNCVLYPNRDRKSSSSYHTDPSSAQVFQKLANFIDCYPSNSHNLLFTFSMNTQLGLLLSRLDYLFMDSAQTHLHTKTSTFYANSDHLAVKTEFFLPPRSTSNNIWKLNTSLLNDKVLRTKLCEHITNFSEKATH